MPRRNKFVREKDLEYISSLYSKGYSQPAIVEKLKESETKSIITQQQVSKDIKEVISRWQESANINITEAKAVELAKINETEREAWIGYEASKQPEEYTRITASGAIRRIQTADGEFVQEKPATTIRTVKQREGDQRWLTIILKCIELRMKILGIEAAVDVNFRVMPLYGENYIDIPNN